jgi:hypothetical protein
LEIFIQHRKTESDYDAEGREIAEITYNWDPDLQDWVVDRKTEHSYETGVNEPILRVKYNWDTVINNWAFDLASRWERSVDANGKETEVLYNNSQWDSNPDDWIAVSKGEFTRDDKENIILTSGYEWESGTERFILIGKKYDSWDATVSFDRDTICNGDSILWNSNYLKKSGFYFKASPSFAWSDALQTYYLDVNPTPASFNIHSGSTKVY